MPTLLSRISNSFIKAAGDTFVSQPEGAAETTTIAEAPEVTVPEGFFVRPSKKRPDVMVVGVEVDGERKRVALLRVVEGQVKVRTLDGNPREKSSTTNTQSEVVLDLDTLSVDA